MALWTKLLFEAGKRLAGDERVREKVANAYREEVRPRAEAAWAKTKPKLDETRADIRRIATETPPQQNPGRFAGRVARSLIDKVKGKDEKDG